MGSAGYGVAYWGNDEIQIGCKKKTIKEWEEQYQEVGKGRTDFTEDQIDEYGNYILSVKQFHKIYSSK